MFFFLVKDIFLTMTILCRWLRGSERNSPGSRTLQPRTRRLCLCTSTRWRSGTRRSRSPSAPLCIIRSGLRHSHRWPSHGPRTTTVGTLHRTGHPSTWAGPDLRTPASTDHHRRCPSYSRHPRPNQTTTAVHLHRRDSQLSHHRSAVSLKTVHLGNHRLVRCSL